MSKSFDSSELGSCNDTTTSRSPNLKNANQLSLNMPHEETSTILWNEIQVPSVVYISSDSERMDDSLEYEPLKQDPLAPDQEDLYSDTVANIRINNNFKCFQPVRRPKEFRKVVPQNTECPYSMVVPNRAAKTNSVSIPDYKQQNLCHNLSAFRGTESATRQCTQIISECEINLETKTWKEDVTLCEPIPSMNVHLNKDQLLKSNENCKPGPSDVGLKSKVSVQSINKLKENKAAQVNSKPVRSRSPLCDSKRIIPRLKTLPQVQEITSRQQSPSTSLVECEKQTSSDVHHSKNQTAKPQNTTKIKLVVKSSTQLAGLQIAQPKVHRFTQHTLQRPPHIRLEELMARKVFKCAECKLDFPSYLNLVEHIKIHDAVDPKVRVDCQLCEKTFKSQLLLDSHVYLYHKSAFDKFVLCHICGSLYETSRFEDHVNKHLGKKNHLCEVCGTSYYSQIYLKYHIRVKHLSAGLPKPKCETCGIEVSTKQCLRIHMESHTEKPSLKCPLCPKLFLRKGQLKRHMLSHTGETPYVCTVCSRGFTIKWNHTQHMRLHTKIKPYVCDVCGEEFRHNVSRRTHMKRHLLEDPPE